jgi:hypothetical protein
VGEKQNARHQNTPNISATACCIGPGTAQKYPTLSIARNTPSFLVRSTPILYPLAQKSLLMP